jgi:hypothetical protein
MELRQMDVVGGGLIEGDTQAKIVSGIDDHSRFMVCARVVERAGAIPVCDAFEGAMERRGHRKTRCSLQDVRGARGKGGTDVGPECREIEGAERASKEGLPTSMTGASPLVQPSMGACHSPEQHAVGCITSGC